MKIKNFFIKELKGGWKSLERLPKVKTLIDIGIGHQGTDGLYGFFPHSRKIFVDPVIESEVAVKKHLLDGKNVFYNLALGGSCGTAEILVRDPISRSGINSKISSESIVEKRQIEMITLDDLFLKERITDSVGVKIDVEGYELEILKGSSEALKICEFIILELPISKPRFKNSYTFFDAIKFMNDHKYALSSIRVSGDGTDHCDIAFIRQK